MCAHIYTSGKDIIITIIVTYNNELHHSKYKGCKYVSSYAVQRATLRKPYNYSLCVAVSISKSLVLQAMMLFQCANAINVV